MTELFGAIGWGLLAFGAITHVWHHQRLRELVAMHLDNERIPALVLTAIEVGLAVAIPVLVLIENSLLPWFAAAAALLAAGFMAWIARLLITGSELPCACSFSSAPTTWWSFGRSVCVGLVALLAATAGPDSSVSASEHLAVLTVGWAIAGFIFVLPEALAWPAVSKVLMARVDAHMPP